MTTTDGPGRLMDALPPRQLTIDDVHRLVGALYLEIQMLQRENAALRAELTLPDHPARATARE